MSYTNQTFSLAEYLGIDKFISNFVEEDLFIQPKDVGITLTIVDDNDEDHNFRIASHMLIDDDTYIIVQNLNHDEFIGILISNDDVSLTEVNLVSPSSVPTPNPPEYLPILVSIPQEDIKLTIYV